jgi:DNA polymerase-3 subunit chi
MTRIDFYVLTSVEPNARYLTACRLAEKAYRLGHRVYVQTESAQADVILDDLLWTFRQNSFVPHERWPNDGNADVPVLLGHDEAPDFLADVLINLGEQIPGAFDRFDRLVEIVDQDGPTRTAGRRRFRHYRERGFAPVAHKLDDAGD